MNNSSNSSNSSDSSKPRLLMRALQTFQRRRASVAFVAGVMLTAGLAGGVTALASESGPMVMHHHAASAADVQAHVGAMLNHLDTELGLSNDQKAHVDPLVMQALSDLMPLHQQLLQLHAQVQPLLMQSPIDRASLETLRAQHLSLLDQASKRVTQLMADVGDQLTPAQRQQLWTHLSQLHGPAHGHAKS